MGHEVDPEPLRAEELARVELRVATVVAARVNPAARVPALVLELDLGPLGTRTTSAQLTRNYAPEDLVGRQVVCVANLPPKRVADVCSEVLVLGALDPERGTVLLALGRPVENGAPVA